VNPRLRRGLVILGILLAPMAIGLLFTFEVIKIPFPTDMSNQPFVDYEEGPRLLPPEGAVPVQGLSIIPDEFPANPVPADPVSLQRGGVLYGIHCQLCHGDEAHGDGPLAERFARMPENLTAAQVSAEFDGSVYLVISLGFGDMPSLSENLTVRERWDVINFLRTLPTR